MTRNETETMANKTVTKQTIQNERTPGGDIPESVAYYIGQHPEKFMEYQTHDRDVEMLMKMSKKQPQEWEREPLYLEEQGKTKLLQQGVHTHEWLEHREDMEQVAWLLWRARLVVAWTADPITRKPTKNWSDAVESGWLKDDLFDQCKEKRANFYAKREARRERLNDTVKGMDGARTATTQERKNSRKAKKQEDALHAKHAADNNPITPPVAITPEVAAQKT